MRKILSTFMIVLLVGCLFVLSGCEKKEEESLPENQTEEEVIIEDKVPTVIDRTNSKLKTDEEVKEAIKGALPEYFDVAYGPNKVADIEVGDIMIYIGDEDDMRYVDLAENDYAFQIDYKIKPANESDAESMTDIKGKYDKDSGWIIENHGYGVMRYNVISDKFDITSITPDSF